VWRLLHREIKSRAESEWAQDDRGRAGVKSPLATPSTKPREKSPRPIGQSDSGPPDQDLLFWIALRRARPFVSGTGHDHARALAGVPPPARPYGCPRRGAAPRWRWHGSRSRHWHVGMCGWAFRQVTRARFIASERCALRMIDGGVTLTRGHGRCTGVLGALLLPACRLCVYWQPRAAGRDGWGWWHVRCRLCNFE